MAELPPDFVTLKSQIVCKQHKDEECSFVCMDCNESMICDECIADVHSGHTVKTLRNFIKDPGVETFLSCDFNILKQQIINGIMRKFTDQKSEIEMQAATLKSTIDLMKEEELKECDKMLTKNMKCVNEFFTLVDPSEFQNTIKDLPEIENKTRNAIVILQFLKYVKTWETETCITTSEEPILVPAFTKGRIQNEGLKDLFGHLEVTNDDTVKDYFKCSLEEIIKGKCAKNEDTEIGNRVSDEEGLHDFVDDSDEK